MIKLNKIIVILLLLLPLSVFAQDDTTQELKVKRGFSVENPEFTLRSFFENLEKDNYNPSIAARTMNFSSLTKGTYSREDLAVKLNKIIVAKGIIINFRLVPNNSNYIDSASLQQIYAFVPELPQIYLEKSGNKWLFSTETIENINKLYDKTIPFDIYKIVDKLPVFFRNSILGFEIWQFIGLAVWIIFAYFLAVLLKYVSRLFLKRLLKRIDKIEVGQMYILPIARNFSQLIGILFLIGSIPILELPTKVNIAIIIVLKVICPIFIIKILFRIVDIFTAFLKRLAAKTANTLDDHLVPFAAKALKVIVVILGAFYILDLLNINITPLLAGVSIGGLAFALAAQETVKNILGSLTIFVDRPFAVKDWIQFSSGEGIVEEIGLRSTKIRTFDDSLISVPNGIISDAVINNLGKRNWIRYLTVLGVTYNTQYELIEQFVEGIKEILMNYPKSKKDNIQCTFDNYGPSSLDIRVVVYLKVDTFYEGQQAKEQLNLQFLRLAESLGISFAFPSQSVYLEKTDMPDKLSGADIAKKFNEFKRNNLSDSSEKQNC